MGLEVCRCWWGVFFSPAVGSAQTPRPTEAGPQFYTLWPVVFAAGNAQATFEYFTYQPLEE